MENLMFELAEKLRDLKDEKAANEKYLKEINSQIEDTEYKLTEAMALAEVSNFTRGDKQFILTTRVNWSAETDQKDALYAALKASGYEHLFSVNAQTLGSFLREQIAETADDKGNTHIPEWLSGLIKSYEKVGITMKNKK